jgi:hypothetical protein
LRSEAPPQLVRQLLEARLQAELSRRASHGISETEVARDWELLQRTISGANPALSSVDVIRAGPLGSSQP